MTDEELLRLLGAARREPDALDDARWDDVAAGRLAPDDPALTDPLERFPSSAEAFRPLDEAARQRIGALFEPAAPNVAPRRPRRAWVMAAVAVPLAAALALFVLWPAALPPLPDYQLERSGGDKLLRAGQAEMVGSIPAMRSTSVLKLALRPARPVGEAVTVIVFDRGPAGIRRLAPEVERSASGALIIEGPVAEIVGPDPGAHTLLLIVTRPDDPPVPIEAAEPLFSRPGRDGARQIFIERLQIVAE